MNLFVGIIGLPNVGKSTLFNTITNSAVEAANYPFATIEPNIGIVNVPDKRLYELAGLIDPVKTTPAICKFVDIAGLVKGASKGEGLGNQFLANIREVDAICHVVRCFDDNKIIHVYNDVNPLRDIEIINLELIMADLEVVNKKIEKIFRKAKSGDKEAEVSVNLYNKIKEGLEKNTLIKDIRLSDTEFSSIKNDGFLTNKKTIYIANINEDDLSNPYGNKYVEQVKKMLGKEDIVLPISISIEFEMSLLDKKEKQQYLAELNLQQTGLDELILTAYKLLNLSTFFTYGKDETKAWTFINGMDAQECAGLIHSDIAKGFIRAEIMNCQDLIRLKSENNVKSAGLLRLEGKKYVMSDGDVCYFRFNL